MNSKCYCIGWPLMVSLAASLFALPSFAAPLTLYEALRLAENNAPSLKAQNAKIQAASSAAIPAGELPDPQLVLGVQNFPIGGPTRGSIDDDFMTMRTVGLKQEVPNSYKRKARIEVADATIARAAAEQRIERLNVRLSTAMAWIKSYSIERKDMLFREFYKENRLLRDTVQAQIANGRSQPADAITPKQEAAQLEEQQDELVRQRVQARASLQRWVGPSADNEPAGSLPNWPIDASGYYHQLPQHPRLAAFEPMTRVAQAQVREAESEKHSDWSWEFDYQHRAREFGDMVSVQFTFDLPLFPDSRQNPKIASKYAKLNQIEAERETVLRVHHQELEATLADYQRHSRAVERSKDTLVPLARKKVELSMASYRAGKGDLGSVITARHEFIEARLKQIDVEEQRALVSARLYLTYGESAQ